MNSKAKGKRGELLFRDVLRLAGYKAVRGRQNRGGPDSPDIICAGLPIHWEVKFGITHSFTGAFRQACEEAGTDQIPAVASKRDREEWMCYLRASDFLRLLAKMKETGFMEAWGKLGPETKRAYTDEKWREIEQQLKSYERR